MAITTAGGDFTPSEVIQEEEISNLKQLTQFEFFWIRFRSHRLAMVGLVVLVLLILMAIFAPFITPGVRPDSIPAYDLNVDLGGPSHPPTFDNFPWRLFGTTNGLNYSILAQITYGARISLFIAFTGAILSSLIGTFLGALSGYFGGAVDMTIMRITDVFLSIPLLPLLITLSAFFIHGSILMIILVFALLTWPSPCRFVQAKFLVLREMEFTQAAKAMGVGNFRIIFRHLLPNALSPVIVLTTLNVAGFVTLEATLDFLGLGVQFPPTATWGNILSAAQGDMLVGDWWWPVFPGLFLVMTVMAVSFIGDGLQDALNVRTRL
jgi:peptide/nickel transport system permease protein